MLGKGGYKMIKDDVMRHFEILNNVNAKTEQLEKLILAAKENEDVLLTPKQVTELLILIGELTLVNAGNTQVAMKPPPPF